MACIILDDQILGFDVSVYYVLLLQALKHQQALGAKILDYIDIQAQIMLLKLEQIHAIYQRHLKNQILSLILIL